MRVSWTIPSPRPVLGMTPGLLPSAAAPLAAAATVTPLLALAGVMRGRSDAANTAASSIESTTACVSSRLGSNTTWPAAQDAPAPHSAPCPQPHPTPVVSNKAASTFHSSAAGPQASAPQQHGGATRPTSLHDELRFKQWHAPPQRDILLRVQRLHSCMLPEEVQVVPKG